jgi:hypothetical protein
MSETSKTNVIVSFGNFLSVEAAMFGRVLINKNLIKRVSEGQDDRSVIYMTDDTVYSVDNTFVDIARALRAN